MATEGPMSDDESPNWREIEMVRLINILRAEEGDSITLICDNPDFNMGANCAVECQGYWTDWWDVRFEADTLLDALSKAFIVYNNFKATGEFPSDHRRKVRTRADRLAAAGDRPPTEIETVGWAILQALHENVEDGPKSWSDVAKDQEKRIKKAAIAAIEAVTDLSQYKAQGFSLPPFTAKTVDAQVTGQPIDGASPELKDVIEHTHRADYKIGWWLSAALEDPAVCAEMKADINAWFEAHQPGLVMASSVSSQERETSKR